jgi:hypothetical protein
MLSNVVVPMVRLFVSFRTVTHSRLSPRHEFNHNDSSHWPRHSTVNVTIDSRTQASWSQWHSEGLWKRIEVARRRVGMINTECFTMTHDG